MDWNQFYRDVKITQNLFSNVCILGYRRKMREGWWRAMSPGSFDPLFTPPTLKKTESLFNLSNLPVIILKKIF
jgi:hypothetical protein